LKWGKVERGAMKKKGRLITRIFQGMQRYKTIQGRRIMKSAGASVFLWDRQIMKI
jgi:hypothetical protein